MSQSSTVKKAPALTLNREAIARLHVQSDVRTGVRAPNSRGECFSVLYNHCGSYNGCKGGPSAGCY
jgi:hypothetical protein